MVNVIGVRFQNAGKLYFFDPGALWPTPGDYVIVETSRGIEFGEVVTQMQEIDDATLSSPLKPIVRIATEEDVQHDKDNRAAEKEAHAICQRKIAEHKLDMKLVTVEYTFDNSKILFYFTANGRVDFRSLVKDLAGVFKTRIELRQIGVRDEAKMIGGLGPCGRQICCGAFLGDFQPVSIKMAKEQNLSLNPNKISGVCGRLMCCLKYEQDQYEAIRKKMPKVGKEVVTPDGIGVVWDLNVIRETVRVRIQKGDSSELKDYPMEEVQRVGQQPHAPNQPAKAENDVPMENEAELPQETADTGEQPNRREKHQKSRREEDGQASRPEKRERRESQKAEGKRTERTQAAETADKPIPQAEEGKPETDDAPVTEEQTETAAAQEKAATTDWKAALARAMAEAGEEING